MRRSRTMRLAGAIARPLLLVPLLALFLAPLALLVASSLREAGRPPERRIVWWPNPAHWENYPAVGEAIALGQHFRNSLAVAALVVPLAILVSSWAGFALAQLPPRWQRRLGAAAFVALMIPLSAVWIPRFLLFREVGLLDSRFALVLTALAGGAPFWTLLFFWTFSRIPREIFEAARLDGAEALGLWARVALPLAWPTVVAVAMLAFLASWSDYVGPLLYIQSTERQTLPYALQVLYGLDPNDWPILMAGAAIVALPPIVVFLVAQRGFLHRFRGAGWLGR